MQVLIVEDEAPARKRLQNLLQQADSSVRVLEMLDSVENTVQWLRHHQPPELMFLDIQLADGLSFDIFGQIPVRCPVIFTTAFHEFILQAFKVNSIDYLLKPIKLEELQAALRKFKDLRQHFQYQPYSAESMQQLLQSLIAPPKEYKNRFLVRLGERLLSIQESEIAYFRAEQKVVLLHTHDDKKYALDYSLDELERLLNPAIFFRLNRQIIAHIKAIQVVHQHFNGKLRISLSPPPAAEEVLVSKEKSSEFKQWLDQ